GEDDARCAGERAGDEEGEGDRPVDVDAHHRGGVLVLSGCAHRLSLLRVADEPHEDDEHENRDGEYEELVPAIRRALRAGAEREDRVVRKGVGWKRYGPRPLPDE